MISEPKMLNVIVFDDALTDNTSVAERVNPIVNAIESLLLTAELNAI